MMPMKAMLLAAGLGTRLRPLTNKVPKCMIPILGKPLLEYNIEYLKKFGVDEVMINLFYLPHLVMNRFGDGSNWGIKIMYSLEKEILGTAGGVKKVADFFEGATFIVWYGDNISTCNLSKLLSFHRAKAGLATIALYQRENVTQSGIVALSKDDRITRFLEKPSPDQVFSHWVNAGIYILEPGILDFISENSASDFSRDVFSKLLANERPIYGYRMSENEELFWIDTLDDLKRTQREIRRMI
jgi:NDP-sugar pyrophosphorylase family protein